MKFKRKKSEKNASTQTIYYDESYANCNELFYHP